MCLSFRELRNVEVVVRKDHTCGWCAETIPRLSTARYRVYVLDGELTRDWMHLECFDAMADSDREVVCEGWMAGDFERGVAA